MKTTKKVSITLFVIVFGLVLSPIVTTNVDATSALQSTEEPYSEEIIHILENSSNPGELNYIERSKLGQFSYFSQDRISIKVGSNVTFVNDDSVAHRVVSVTGLGQHDRVLQKQITICETPQEKLPEGFSFTNKGSDCTFNFDGRIDSETIQSGESWTGSFDDAGVYKIIDPDYPWMNLIIYAFPETDSIVIRNSDGKPNN